VRAETHDKLGEKNEYGIQLHLPGQQVEFHGHRFVGEHLKTGKDKGE
jgi:hypothetical protein